MMVGQDVPLGIDDHSAPQPLQLSLEFLGHFRNTEEVPKERIIFERQERVRNFLFLGHLDVHYGRNRLFGHLGNGGA